MEENGALNIRRNGLRQRWETGRPGTSAEKQVGCRGAGREEP